MVARAEQTHSDPPATLTGVPGRLFMTWRVLLTRFGRMLAGSRSDVTTRARHVASALGDRVRASTDRASVVTRGGVDEVADSVVWLFNGWRRALTRVLSKAQPRARIASVRSTFTDAVAVLVRPESFGSLDATRADRLAALGLRALVVGSILGVVIGRSGARFTGPAIAAAATGLLWAVARLAILLALAPRDRRQRTLTVAVWGFSLLPYLIGVTDGLRLVALAVSAFICFGALRGAGLKHPTVRRMTLWAFGGQVGISAVGWLLLGGLALLATR